MERSFCSLQLQPSSSSSSPSSLLLQAMASADVQPKEEQVLLLLSSQHIPAASSLCFFFYCVEPAMRELMPPVLNSKRGNMSFGGACVCNAGRSKSEEDSSVCFVAYVVACVFTGWMCD